MFTLLTLCPLFFCHPMIEPLEPEDDERIVLDGDRWDAFEAMLESPPREERPVLGSFAWGDQR